MTSSGLAIPSRGEELHFVRIDGLMVCRGSPSVSLNSTAVSNPMKLHHKTRSRGIFSFFFTMIHPPEGYN
jgi:hypothetical protein